MKCKGEKQREPQIDDWHTDEAFARHFLEGIHPLVSNYVKQYLIHFTTSSCPPFNNCDHPSQALRLVRSLNELKNELRSLTVRVDGKKETIEALLKSQRWSFYKDQYTGKEYELDLSKTNCAHPDFSCLIILPLPRFASYLEGFSMLRK